MIVVVAPPAQLGQQHALFMQRLGMPQALSPHARMTCHGLPCHATGQPVLCQVGHSMACRCRRAAGAAPEAGSHPFHAVP